MSNDERRIEMNLDIETTPERLWEAITDAKELERWFPINARVKPGVGGNIYMDWGEGWAGTAEIEAWEPGTHLRTVWIMPAGEGAEPVRLGVDWFIEAKSGGVTTLRLVHSGFSGDGAWDEQFDGIRRGWMFELRGLRHYLQQHAGADRAAVRARRAIGPDLQTAWARLTGPDGLNLTLTGTDEGAPFSLGSSTDAMSGTVAVYGPPRDFAGVLSEHNKAYLRLGIDKPCQPGATGHEATLWLWTYGVDDSVTERITEHWQSMLDRLFVQSHASA